MPEHVAGTQNLLLAVVMARARQSRYGVLKLLWKAQLSEGGEAPLCNIAISFNLHKPRECLRSRVCLRRFDARLRFIVQRQGSYSLRQRVDLAAR